MANYLNITAGWSLVNSADSDSDNLQITTSQLNQGGSGGVIYVPSASSVAMPTGATISYGLLTLKNLNEVVDVRFGGTSSGSLVPVGTLNRNGGFGIFYMNQTATIRLQATTSTAKVKYNLLEL